MTKAARQSRDKIGLLHRQKPLYIERKDAAYDAIDTHLRALDLSAYKEQEVMRLGALPELEDESTMNGDF